MTASQMILLWDEYTINYSTLETIEYIQNGNLAARLGCLRKAAHKLHIVLDDYVLNACNSRSSVYLAVCNVFNVSR
jgi:hypothetical protein